jgi:hypothetical protein
MGDNVGFARFAGIASVLVLPFTILLGVLSWAAYSGDVGSFVNGSLVSGGAHTADLLRWSLLVDMFGYYLMVLPLVVLLWIRLRGRGEALARFAAFTGFGYVLVGAIGAAVLSVVDPLLIQRFADVPSQREAVRVVFDTFTRGLAIGLWNMLEQLLLAAWLMGIGVLLRPERRALSTVAILGGAFALADAVGRIVDFSALYNVGAVGTVLLPVVVVWMGVELLRQPATWPAARTTEPPAAPLRPEGRRAA